MLCKHCGTKLIHKQPNQYTKGYCSSRCYSRAWKIRNRCKVRRDLIDTASKRLKERREYLARIKSSPCTDCGIKYPSYVMDFDHVRGEKIRNVSQMLRYGLESLKTEIAKCDLVCSNCHRERTHQRRLTL